jgi:hypothetical protein
MRSGAIRFELPFELALELPCHACWELETLLEEQPWRRSTDTTNARDGSR